MRLAKIILLFFVLVTFGCTVEKNSTVDKNDNNHNEISEEDSLDSTIDFINTYQKTPEVLMDRCIDENLDPDDAQCIARIEVNYTWCDFWDNESDHEDCIDRVSLFHLFKEDIDCTDFIHEDMQNLCKVIKGKVSDCSLIDGESVYDLCMAYQKENGLLAKDDFNVYCEFKFFEDDPIECNLTGFDRIYYEALVQGNESLCITNRTVDRCENILEIKYQDYLDEFYREVVGKEVDCSVLHNSKECRDSTQRLRDEGLLFEVMRTFNGSLCRSIVNNSIQTSCKSIITKNLSLCKSLEDYSKYRCLIALKEYGLDGCSNLTDEGMRRNCEAY